MSRRTRAWQLLFSASLDVDRWLASGLDTRQRGAVAQARVRATAKLPRFEALDGMDTEAAAQMRRERVAFIAAYTDA